MLASEYFLLYRPLLSVSVKCLLNIYYVLSMVVSAKDRKMRKTNVAFAFLITDSFKIVLFISIIKLSDRSQASHFTSVTLGFCHRKNESIELESVFQSLSSLLLLLFMQQTLFLTSRIVCTAQYVKQMEHICKLWSKWFNGRLESTEHCLLDLLFSPQVLSIHSYEQFLLSAYYVLGTLIAAGDTEHRVGKDVHNCLLCASSSRFQDTTEYKRKRGVKDDSMFFVLSNWRDGVVIK